MTINLKLAVILLTASSLFWSGNFFFGKVAHITDLSPFKLSFFRWSLALLLLLPFTLKSILENFKYYKKNDFMAPFASGSAQYKTMIVAPCSMGTLARIATGVSNDLVTRAADVILKERRKLILINRDTPLNLIHINNMKLITEAGGIICPATPSFYSHPKTFEELAATVIDRVVMLAELQNDSYSWGEEQ